MTKKSVLGISLVYMIYAVSILLVAKSCISSQCKIYDNDFLGLIFMDFIVLFPVFLFSLITYKMREEMFQAWWRFARWFVPVIIVVTFYFNSLPAPRGFLQSDPRPLFLGILYIIFIFVSTIKIVRAYRRSK